MKNRIFNQIKVRRPGKNAFDLSQEKKLSMNMGDLVPILIQDVVPGDTFRVKTEHLIRLAPMVSPVMHRVNVYTHFFFVPYRLVYDEWEKFITGGLDGTAVPSFPKLTVSEGRKAEFKTGSLGDYMGVPVPDQTLPIVNSLDISALPFRAYQKIYNEYFRDQTLTPEVPITSNSTTTSEEANELLKLRKRSWEKDYFTSALPWSQRGGEVTIPNTVDYSFPQKVTDQFGFPVSGNLSAGTTNPGQLNIEGETPVMIENVDGLAISVNDLRKAARLQEWLEKNARAGSRYIEQIFSHFGVKSSDARLQRPEYLGGGKTPISISEVLATFNNAETPGGNMYGHGISVGTNNSFKRFFEEHGVIIGLMSVLPRTAYQQGVPKFLTKFDKFDNYFPEFAQLGEQEVLNKEIFMTYQDDPAHLPESTFGYQSRYAEYKFNQSTVHGDFKNTLEFWHMGRTFTSAPSLNASFVEADPTQRIFAVTDPDVHKLYVQLYNDIKAIRPMPIFGTPTL